MAQDGTIKNTKFQVDTAATCNHIHKEYLKDIVDICDPEVGIQPTNVTINMYNGASVTPAGIIDLMCMRGKQCLALQFYVMDGLEFCKKPPLMCGTDCELLNIVHMNVDEIHSINATPPQGAPSSPQGVPLTEAYKIQDTRYKIQEVYFPIQ